MNLIENLAKNQKLIKEYQNKGYINEELTKADIEIIKRLVISGIEGVLTNLFIRRNIATSGINWRE